LKAPPFPCPSAHFDFLFRRFHIQSWQIDQYGCFSIPTNLSGRNIMEVDKTRSESSGTEAGPVEGTKDMGYWEFKKEVCDKAGWQLRRTDAQTYMVVNGKHEKMGIFKSGEGYFPDPEAVTGVETPNENT
jgi:hypothetical protein